jgi:peroxiredoxin
MRIAGKIRIAMAVAVGIATVGMMTAAEVPRKAPEFSIEFPDGGQKLLSQYRGKVVCLEFLYTTCPHCMAASKLTSQLLAEYGAKGFQPLGVAFNNEPVPAKTLVPAFVKENQVKYPVGYSTREAVTAFMGVSPETRLSVPHIVFIDRKGIIRQESELMSNETLATEENMRKMIETLLKEPASGATKKTASTIARKKTS